MVIDMNVQFTNLICGSGNNIFFLVAVTVAGGASETRLGVEGGQTVVLLVPASKAHVLDP